ncbi:MAG: adenylate/guanylate cyclase domain-containing protein, partial [Chloroflexota bacterium]
MSRLGHAYLVSFTQEEICQSQQAKVNRMQSISHYIPYEQRIALAEDFELSSRTEGTVLFADISGFTPLTQSLSRELGGKRGAEELTDYLNEIYGRLIYQAHQYQGSIISFSGDAITCWFDAQGSNLLTTAKRAMTAAQLMQTVIAEMEEIRLPDGRLIRLGIKVGLASGPARRFVVGKSDIQKILTIAGKTLDYVANAEKLSNTGEIILAPETFVLLKDELDAVAVREGDEGRQYTTVKDYQGQVEEAPWPQITADTPLEKQIEWLLPPVHQRLLEGQENFLAELRPTVPLFLRFDGIDYDHDEEAGQKLDLFIQWVQSVVNSYSGHLIQLTIGDKGSYLYVTFGALIANEDDPVRALLSADILKNIPPRLNFISSIQIGVSYGHTYTGAYGGEQRKTYGVLGNDVNLAARLMGMAQDRTVFVSSRIKKATENAFDFASMGLKKIKGLDEPIPIFELGQRKASFSHNSESTLDAVVFGREAEKAVLNERLKALVQQNQGSTVIIRGEAGMGKSQLVGYLMQQIEQLSDSEKTAVYIGAGSSIEKSTPYHGWRSIFSEIFDLTSIEYGDTYLKDAEQAIRSKLAEVDPEFEQLLPLLSQILQVSIEDNELTAQMVGQARANSTNKLLIQTLKQINDSTPLTLIIEDTHWLDSSSWTLLEEVRNSLDSMLLVIVTRPSFDKTISKLEVIESKENVYPLDIDSMPQDAIEALICHRLKATSIPQPLLNIITAKAEGNPFFSEEIAYALRDTGIIRVEDGVCHIADGLENLNTFQFPDNIHGIITSRIDSLHPSHQL